MKPPYVVINCEGSPVASTVWLVLPGKDGEEIPVDISDIVVGYTTSHRAGEMPRVSLDLIPARVLGDYLPDMQAIRAWLGDDE